MSVAEENITVIVYHTDPMHQTGKAIEDGVDTLKTATQAFWRNYQTTTTNSTLPQPFRTAFALFMDTCENPLFDVLTQRKNLGTTLKNAATQAVNLDGALQASFQPAT